MFIWCKLKYGKKSPVTSNYEVTLLVVLPRNSLRTTYLKSKQANVITELKQQNTEDLHSCLKISCKTRDPALAMWNNWKWLHYLSYFKKWSRMHTKSNFYFVQLFASFFFFPPLGKVDSDIQVGKKKHKT